MDADRVQDLKVKASERWKICEACAIKLDVDKTEVHNFFWQLFKDRNFFEPVMDGNPEVLAIVKETVEWQRMLRARESVIHLEEKPVQRRTKRKSSPATDSDSQIRAALWLIRHVGGVEQAKKAVEAAANALQQLKGTSDDQ